MFVDFFTDFPVSNEIFDVKDLCQYSLEKENIISKMYLYHIWKCIVIQEMILGNRTLTDDFLARDIL